MSNLLLSLRDEGRRGSPAASHFLLSRQKKVTQDKVAGGCPAASHFLLLRQKKVTKEKATPGLPVLRTSLRYSPSPAAAELGPYGASDSPRRNPRTGLRYSAALTGPKVVATIAPSISQPKTTN